MTTEEILLKEFKGRKLLKKTTFGDLQYFHFKCEIPNCDKKQVYLIKDGEILRYYHLPIYDK